jgi:hypothetical protein
VVCDEHGIGGDGEYCGGNDAQLFRFNVLYHEASGGKSPLGDLSRPENLVNKNAGVGNNWAKGHCKRAAGHEYC